jgi:hypothetical protein
MASRHSKLDGFEVSSTYQLVVTDLKKKPSFVSKKNTITLLLNVHHIRFCHRVVPSEITHVYSDPEQGS